MHNLLVEDPLIRIRFTGAATERLSLPDVYVAPRADRVVGFPALRPHQRHAWHAFLAQLAAIALECAAASSTPESARLGGER